MSHLTSLSLNVLSLKPVHSEETRDVTTIFSHHAQSRSCLLLFLFFSEFPQSPAQCLSGAKIWRVLYEGTKHPLKGVFPFTGHPHLPFLCLVTLEAYAGVSLLTLPQGLRAPR